MTSEKALKWLRSEEGQKAQEKYYIDYSSDHGGGLRFTWINTQVRVVKEEKSLLRKIIELFK